MATATQNKPYEVKEVHLSETEAESMGIYGPFYNVFGKDGKPYFRQSMTWSDAAFEAARLNES
jgi:hypothetical protein